MERPWLVVAVALVASALLASTAVASPQPSPVCGVCGSGLTDGPAEHEGLGDLTVVRSVATVRVHADGSATWRVRNELANGSATASLRENPALLDRLVEDALRAGVVEGPVENRSATMNGTTMHVRFTDPTAATRSPGGVYVVRYLHAGGLETWHALTADRFSVVGPAGTTVANDPPEATVDGRTATWRGDSSGDLWDVPSLRRDAYVAFAEDGVWATGRAHGALIAATLPIVADVVGSFHLPGLVPFALGAFGAAWAGSRTRDRLVEPSPRAIALATMGLGSLAIAFGVFRSPFGFFGRTGIALHLGLLYAVLGGVAAVRADDARVVDLLAAGTLALVCVAALEVVVSSGSDRPLLRAASSAVRLLPVVLAVPFGAAVAAGDRNRTLVATLALLGAFFVAELSVAWPTTRPFGPVVLVFAAGGVGTLVVATLPFLLGGAVSGAGPAASGDDSS